MALRNSKPATQRRSRFVRRSDDLDFFFRQLGSSVQFSDKRGVSFSRNHVTNIVGLCTFYQVLRIDTRGVVASVTNYVGRGVRNGLSKDEKAGNSVATNQRVSSFVFGPTPLPARIGFPANGKLCGLVCPARSTFRVDHFISPTQLRMNPHRAAVHDRINGLAHGRGSHSVGLDTKVMDSTKS